MRRWKLVGGGNLRHGGCLEDMDKTVQGIQNIKKTPNPEVQNTQDTIHRTHEAQEEGRPKCGYFGPS